MSPSTDKSVGNIGYLTGRVGESLGWRLALKSEAKRKYGWRMLKTSLKTQVGHVRFRRTLLSRTLSLAPRASFH